jgi:membrane-bound lytic murein transglycosylase F
MAKPEYYERLKAGRARGGEAVILVENVRTFYDILVRFEELQPSTLLQRLGLPPMP